MNKPLDIEAERFNAARDEAWAKVSVLTKLSVSGFVVPRSPKFDQWFEAGWLAAKRDISSQAPSGQQFCAAIDSVYPIPASQHTSVIQRATDNRIAFRWGWERHAELVASQAAPVAPHCITCAGSGSCGEVVCWDCHGTGRAAPVAPIRSKLHEMHNDEGEKGWYFDCDGQYIDVEKDETGKYSVFFKDRKTGETAWFDQAEVPVAPVQDDGGEESAEDGWRRLALQFDAHRLQAIGLLRLLWKEVYLMTKHETNEHVEKFLAAGPLSGEEVLAQRIAAIAAKVAPVQAGELPSILSVGVLPHENVVIISVQLKQGDHTTVLYTGTHSTSEESLCHTILNKEPK